MVPVARQNSRRGRALAVLLAAGLREAWEEMRLNPLGVSFLGVAAQQHLVMFDRVIHPLVGWAPPSGLNPIGRWRASSPCPLRKLLDPGHYGRFRPMVTRRGRRSCPAAAAH
jgi:hypothetical protein